MLTSKLIAIVGEIFGQFKLVTDDGPESDITRCVYFQHDYPEEKLRIVVAGPTKPTHPKGQQLVRIVLFSSQLGFNDPVAELLPTFASVKASDVLGDKMELLEQFIVNHVTACKHCGGTPIPIQRTIILKDKGIPSLCGSQNLILACPGCLEEVTISNDELVAKLNKVLKKPEKK